MGYNISVVDISLVLGCHGFWVFCYGTDRVHWFVEWGAGCVGGYV